MRANFDRLAPPPRPVPLSATLYLVCSGVFNQIGWFLLLFSTPFVWGFVANSDLLSPIVFRTGTEVVDGRVTRTQATGASEGGVQVQAVEYAYRTDDGLHLTGTSYVTAAPPAVGAPVGVEYVRWRPQLSRIEGMRRGMFGPGTLFVLIFPGIGAALVYFAARSGWSERHLLAHGVLAEARFQAEEETNMTINDRPVMRLVFEFVTQDGESRRVDARTTDTAPLRDETKEWVLYLPARPRIAQLVDQFSEGVEADESGQLRLGSAGRVGLSLILPLLVLLGNAACFVRGVAS